MVTEKSFQDAPARDREPLLFHVAKLLERKNIRGSTRFLKSLDRIGVLARPVDYRIGDSLRILVPIARNGYDHYDIEHYETEFLDALRTAIQQIPASFTLIDCGADIGIISIKLLAICPSITRTVAFEPNYEAYPWLKHNLDRLKIPARAIHAAVADFEGKGRLVAPEEKWTPGMETNHTQYFLEPIPDGPIDVTTIDSLGCPASESLAIKLDLEGGELAALRGASRTISSAPNVVVAIEAHPAVAARTGIDPAECLRFLASLRPFLFAVSETGQTLDPSRPVFEQIAPTQVYNILARTN